MLLRGLLQKFLDYVRQQESISEAQSKPNENTSRNVLNPSEVLTPSSYEQIDSGAVSEPSSTTLDPISQAKKICVEKLLIPFEGTGPRTADGKFKAYKDPAGKNGLPITIAWGLTYHADGRPIQLGEVWDREYALEVKEKVLDKFVSGVLELCPNLISEDPRRLAAVVSFAYNVGLGNLKVSTLKRKINRKEWEAASKEFAKWNKANGKVMKGLVRRRAAESRLFLLED